jgi:hypothetical protein
VRRSRREASVRGTSHPSGHHKYPSEGRQNRSRESGAEIRRGSALALGPAPGFAGLAALGVVQRHAATFGTSGGLAGFDERLGSRVTVAVRRFWCPGRRDCLFGIRCCFRRGRRFVGIGSLFGVGLVDFSIKVAAHCGGDGICDGVDLLAFVPYHFRRPNALEFVGDFLGIDARSKRCRDDVGVDRFIPSEILNDTQTNDKKVSQSFTSRIESTIINTTAVWSRNNGTSQRDGESIRRRSW